MASPPESAQRPRLLPTWVDMREPLIFEREGKARVRRNKIEDAVQRALLQRALWESAEPPRPEGPVTKIRKRPKPPPDAQPGDDAPLQYDPLPEKLRGYAGVVKPMPRRNMRKGRSINVEAPPVDTKLDFEAGVFQVIGRLLTWARAFGLFALGVLWDKLARRDTPEARAKRLLRTFQRAGGTFIKVGQQLAMRVDVLPYAYCRELTKLLDSVEPFPVEQAVAQIERSLAMPLDEAFETFDPVPIGSASIACVYQAILKNGTKVAVKVRRPDVGRVFAADLKAMKWGIQLMDFFTLVRPGLMKNFVKEFESSLMEELDFRKEARYQDLFRRYAKKKKLTRRHYYFTTPKVFFELSSSDVIIQEFTSGMWAWEIIAAVEQGDEAALARMRELNIDPKIVAKRILWVCYWQTMSNFMFHADPHPANILVKADNEIVFIDFGACGTLDSAKRELFEEIFYHQSRKDVYGMAQCIIGLLEPLPHIDINDFEKELEFVMWEAMCKMWSKKSPWYERTSAALWLSFFDLTRRYQLPVNLDTVRMFRSNMLGDSLAIRICNDINVYDEYAEFAKDQEALVAKRVKRSMTRRLRRGMSDRDYAMVEDLLKTGNRAVFKAKRLLNRQIPSFSYMVEKSVSAILVLVNTLVSCINIFVCSCGFLALFKFMRRQPLSLTEIISTVLGNQVFYAAIAVVILVNLRRILFRLNDRDVD